MLRMFPICHNCCQSVAQRLEVGTFEEETLCRQVVGVLNLLFGSMIGTKDERNTLVAGAFIFHQHCAHLEAT